MKRRSGGIGASEHCWVLTGVEMLPESRERRTSHMFDIGARAHGASSYIATTYRCGDLTGMKFVWKSFVTLTVQTVALATTRKHNTVRLHGYIPVDNPGPLGLPYPITHR